MKKQTQQGNIWVFTTKAYDRALELGLWDANRRHDGMPAYLGNELCGEYVPYVWFEKGYVRESAQA